MIKDLPEDHKLAASSVYLEIKHAALFSLSEESFLYPTDEILNRKRIEGDPTSAQRSLILYTFQEEGAIKILRVADFTRRQVPTRWLIEVVRSEFNTFEEKLNDWAFEGAVNLWGTFGDENNETTFYENSVLFFKLGDGSKDSVDFSSAPILRNIFECFWELKKRKSLDVFTPKELISIHQELFGKSITRRYLASQISNIRNKKINPKPELKERFKFEFIKDSNSWKITLY